MMTNDITKKKPLIHNVQNKARVAFKDVRLDLNSNRNTASGKNSVVENITVITTVTRADTFSRSNCAGVEASQCLVGPASASMAAASRHRAIPTPMMRSSSFRTNFTATTAQ